jgi:large subunit ribosomal protein L29
MSAQKATTTAKATATKAAKAKYNGSSKAAKNREASLADLRLAISKAKDEVLDLRIRKATGQVDNPIRLRVLRRDIARCKTITAEKTNAANAAATAAANAAKKAA